MIKTSIKTGMGQEVVIIFETVLKINDTLRYQINYHG
jgi:hypothetical protein